MASNSQVWKTNSTKIENGVIKVYNNGKYKTAGGNNALSTITAKNPQGYVKLDSDSSNPLVKKLSYAVQNDGKITYLYEDGTGNRVQYNSVQEIANGGLRGYDADTTKLIKTNLQGKLEKSASVAKIPGASNPDATENNAGNTGNDDTANEGGNGSPSPIDLTISGPQNRPTGGYRYPIELGSAAAENLDRIEFTQGEYVGTKIGGGGNFSLTTRAFSDRNFKFFSDNVAIGIQPSISDKNTVQWNGSKLNELQAQAAQLSLQVMRSDGIEGAGKTIFDALKGVTDELKSEGSDAAKALNVFFAAKAAGIDPGQLTSRVSGAVLNPNLELLFEGPTLRQFNYTFTMSGRSAAETGEIKGIIKYFKQGMAINKDNGGGLFLKAPNVFQLKYIKGEGSDNHDGLNLIKTCALLDCSVDYTPEGNYSTFSDGSMSLYKLSLSFGELNPIYAEDYNKAAHQIGY